MSHFLCPLFLHWSSGISFLFSQNDLLLIHLLFSSDGLLLHQTSQPSWPSLCFTAAFPSISYANSITNLKFSLKVDLTLKPLLNWILNATTTVKKAIDCHISRKFFCITKANHEQIQLCATFAWTIQYLYNSPEVFSIAYVSGRSLHLYSPNK